MQPIFIHSVENTTEHKFIKPAKLVTYTIGDKLGKSHYWEVNIKPLQTVHAVVLDKDSGLIVLVRQTRVPVAINTKFTDGITVEACAGMVDKYEGKSNQVELVLIDELKEELGYIVTEDNLLKVDTLLSNVGATASVTHLFLVIVDKNTEQVKLDPKDGENLERYYLPIDDVPNFMATVHNTDATTKYLLAGLLASLTNAYKESHEK